MKHIDVLIKPASGLCNMRCAYCFYSDLLSHNMSIDKAIMSEAVLEALVCKSFEEAEESIFFSFQGGEPTLAGLEFYKHFTDLVRANQKPGVGVHFSIQTNGLELDERWCDFFHAYNFLVGLSLDGLRDIHDANRVDAQGKRTYSRVATAYDMLCKKGVDTNILCVITGETARRSQAVYQAIKRIGCRHMQFIPCLDPLEQSRGSAPYSLSPERYVNFLKVLFDQWYADWQDGNYHSIRLFDDYARIAAGLEPATCATSGRCGLYAVIEADGSVFPCDFYVSDRWRLGSITEQSLSELFTGDISDAFIQESAVRPVACMACAYQALCRGGCKRDWLVTENGTKNYYCRAFQDFFDYTYERLSIVGEAERRARKTETRL